MSHATAGTRESYLLKSRSLMSHTSGPFSFAEIRELQSQPSIAGATVRRSLRDIQTEEAELQSEAESTMGWTAEEERITKPSHR